MISIIIPTRNEEKIIDKHLASLKSRLTIPHEIIVTDGGSTDKTIEIAEKYATQVLVHRDTTKRQTVSEGKNDAACVAKGDYLVFLDADCVIGKPDPDAFFTAAIMEFEKNPKLVGLTARIAVNPEVCTRTDTVMYFITNWIYIIFGTASGEFQMIRKDAFEKVGGYRSVISEDLDMFIRLKKLGKKKLMRNLVVWNTGRRQHEIGWLRLYTTWTLDASARFLFNTSFSKEWKPIR